MFEQDAIDQGLLPGKPKQAPSPGNKIAPLPASNKATPPPEVPPEDLTTVPGIGVATSRSLVSQGVRSLAQLREADLDQLKVSPAARKAIEAWRG